jgi:Fe-S-cluster-containing dehydrogenase component
MHGRHEQGTGACAGWEPWARGVLDGTDHDSDLGVRVARDAQRVVAGELDDDEFDKRYRGEDLAEFGSDERPRLAGGLAPGPRLRMAVSRQAMAALGGAAVGMLFVGEVFCRAAFATPASGLQGQAAAAIAGAAAPGRALDVQFGMVIDLERCDGYLTCVRACVDENGLSDGVLWPYVFVYQEPYDVDPRYLVRLCQHCTRAPCVMVCPTGARHRRLADGLVLTDYDVCIGCRYCQVACPYGVNVFQWADPDTYGGGFEGERRDTRGVAVKGAPPKGVMGKCTFCPLRQDDPERRGTAACADACPMDALHIGDLNNPDSAPNRYFATRREEAGGNLPTFRLLEDLGTEPNIVYIGQPPSNRAELVEGPWSYEDWGLTEDRRAVLEGPDPWFRRLARKA